jgi:hypothetical protein
VHSFASRDGAFPKAGLVQGTDGNFYETTLGHTGRNGNIFRLSMGLGPFVKTLPVVSTVGRGYSLSAII